MVAFRILCPGSPHIAAAWPVAASAKANKRANTTTKPATPISSGRSWNVAHSIIRYHKAARRFYQRKRAQRNGALATRALAHKLGSGERSHYVRRAITSLSTTDDCSVDAGGRREPEKGMANQKSEWPRRSAAKAFD